MLSERLLLVVVLLASLAVSACPPPATTPLPANALQECEQQLQWPAHQLSGAADPRRQALWHLAQHYMQAQQFQAAQRLLLALLPVQAQFAVDEQIQLLRQLGISHYRLGQSAAALAWFRQAEQLARTHEQARLHSYVLSDLGTTYKALEQWPQALQSYTESLRLKTQLHDEAGRAVTLHNIGSLYANLGDVRQSSDYLQQAIALYQQQQLSAKAAHAREELAVLLLQTDAAAAVGELTKLLAEASAPLTELRLRQWRMAGYLALNQLAAAQQDMVRIDQLEQQVGPQQLSAISVWRKGQWLDAQQKHAPAADLLQQALRLAQQQQHTSVQQDILKSLQINAMAQQQWPQALDYQQQAAQLRQQQLQQRLDQQTELHRAEFDYEQQRGQIQALQQQNQIATLTAQIQQARFWNLLAASVAVALLLLGLLWWQRRLRQRQLQQWQTQLAWHQRQLQQLETSHQAWQQLIEQWPQPMLLYSTDGQLLQANAAFIARYQAPPDLAQQLPLRGLLGDTHEFWRRHDEGNDAAAQFRLQQLTLPWQDNQAAAEVEVVVTVLPGETGWVLVQCNGDQPAAPSQAAPSLAELYVQVMQQSLAMWELATGKSRIELAEQSGIWRVSIDDGRIRTRSFDRYLALKTLPKQPRWREVVRTAHFVLAQCSQTHQPVLGMQQQLHQLVLQLRQQLREQGATLPGELLD